MTEVNDVSLVDVWRLLVMTVSLWLGMLVLSLARARWREIKALGVDERTHPLTYLSYAITLFAIVGFRAKHLGEPLTSELVVSTIIVALGLAGVLLRVEFTRPGRR